MVDEYISIHQSKNVLSISATITGTKTMLRFRDMLVKYQEILEILEDDGKPKTILDSVVKRELDLRKGVEEAEKAWDKKKKPFDQRWNETQQMLDKEDEERNIERVQGYPRTEEEAGPPGDIRPCLPGR